MIGSNKPLDISGGIDEGINFPIQKNEEEPDDLVVDREKQSMIDKIITWNTSTYYKKMIENSQIDVSKLKFKTKEKLKEIIDRIESADGCDTTGIIMDTASSIITEGMETLMSWTRYWHRINANGLNYYNSKDAKYNVLLEKLKLRYSVDKKFPLEYAFAMTIIDNISKVRDINERTGCDNFTKKFEITDGKLVPRLVQVKDCLESPDKTVIKSMKEQLSNIKIGRMNEIKEMEEIKMEKKEK